MPFQNTFFMVKACENNKGAGFVTYQWPLPGTDDNCPKISYVKLYEPWDWVVGTGVFIDNSNKELIRRSVEFANNESYRKSGIRQYLTLS